MNRTTRMLAAAIVLSLGACGGEDNNTTANNTTANNTTANNTTGNTTANSNASTGGFQATGTYVGADLTFACTTFEAGDGNIASYTSSIDVYVMQCRSTDGTTSVKLGIAAPVAGTTVDYTVATEGVTYGGIMEIVHLGAADTNRVSNSVTFDTVEQGTKLVGSFAAEWDATDGGRVATISGTFDVDF